MASIQMFNESVSFVSRFLIGALIRAQTQRFTWKIPHSSKLLMSPKCIAHQKVSFHVGAGIGISTNFVCIMTTTSEMFLSDRGLGFSVKLAEPFPTAEIASKANVNVALDILSNTEMPFYSGNFSRDLESLQQGFTIDFNYVFPKYTLGIPKDLLQPEDDTPSVHLTATIFYLEAKPATHFSSILTTFNEKFRHKMLQDLKTIYQESGSWKHLQTSTELKVNRGILCARSPVFRTMFQTEMCEADSGKVRIDEIPSKALDVFLHFVHAGELKENWNEAGILEGLTYAAHKYELKNLFEFLNLALGHLVKQENCGKLINIANALKMEQAEKELMDYFKKNVTSIDQAGRIMIEATSVLDLYPKESATK